MKIIPSAASADPLRIADELEKIRGHPTVHIDIEDGNFLPNITFGQKTVRKLTSIEGFEFDLHLLVCQPLLFLQQLRDCPFSHICFHIEASAYPLREINQIKRMGAKAGIALNFKTGVRELAPFLAAIDYVVIMTAEPDDEDEAFQPAMIEKLKEARAFLPRHIELWADGGISAENIALLKDTADTVIMGRAVWNSENPLHQIRTFEHIEEV